MIIEVIWFTFNCTLAIKIFKTFMLYIIYVYIFMNTSASGHSVCVKNLKYTNCDKIQSFLKSESSSISDGFWPVRSLANSVISLHKSADLRRNKNVIYCNRDKHYEALKMSSIACLLMSQLTTISLHCNSWVEITELNKTVESIIARAQQSLWHTHAYFTRVDLGFKQKTTPKTVIVVIWPPPPITSRSESNMKNDWLIDSWCRSWAKWTWQVRPKESRWCGQERKTNVKKKRKKSHNDTVEVERSSGDSETSPQIYLWKMLGPKARLETCSFFKD